MLAMTNLANPHDAFFKQFLSRPEVAEDFLRQHLPDDIVPLLDLSALALQKDTFVDEELRSHMV
jgi:predicted transposase YdaD